MKHGIKNLLLRMTLTLACSLTAFAIAEEPYTFEYEPFENDALVGSTGLIIPPDWQTMAPFESPATDETLPVKWDWREKNVLAPIKNQGSCGSCWAFGSAAVMESAIAIATGSIPDISEQQLVSCRPSFGSCRGGFFAVGFYQNYGANYQADFPYVARNTWCKAAASHEKITRWGYVGQQGRTPTTQEIKTAIHKYGPVAVTVSASGMFSRYKSGVYNACNGIFTNHIVNLVGWDDKDNAWIMRNSWGTKWGEEGYMRIKYADQRGVKCNRIGNTAVFGVYEKK